MFLDNRGSWFGGFLRHPCLYAGKSIEVSAWATLSIHYFPRFTLVECESVAPLCAQYRFQTQAFQQLNQACLVFYLRLTDSLGSTLVVNDEWGGFSIEIRPIFGQKGGIIRAALLLSQERRRKRRSQYLAGQD